VPAHTIKRLPLLHLLPMPHGAARLAPGSEFLDFLGPGD